MKVCLCEYAPGEFRVMSVEKQTLKHNDKGNLVLCHHSEKLRTCDEQLAVLPTMEAAADWCKEAGHTIVKRMPEAS